MSESGRKGVSTMDEKKKKKKTPRASATAPEHSGREERFRSLFMGCPVSLWEEDITGLLVHLEELRTSGVRELRSYFAGHPGEVVRCTGLIKIIGVNNATLDLYEAPDEQSLLAGLSSVFTEESFAAFRDIVIALFEGRTLFEIEATNRTLQGKELKVHLKWSLLPDSGGKLTRVLLSAMDLTERKRTEEERRNNGARLSRAQAIAHVGDWEWDIATNAVHWSDELYRIYGFQPREIAPDYGLVLQQMHPASKDEFLQAIDAALKEDRHFELDYRFRRKDGTDAVLHTIGQVFRDASGAPLRMVGTVQEITLQKEAERRLRDSEDRFRSIFENAIDGIMIGDAGTHMHIEANKAMCAMLGYTRDELLRLRVADIHPKEALPHVLNAFGRQLRGEISLAEDIPMLRKDGAVLSADVNSVPITLGGRQCLIGVFRDITERKQADAALKAREKQLAESQRIAHIGSWEHNLTTGKVVWSDEMFRLLGFDPRKDPADFKMFFDMIHPDDRPALKKAIDETVKAGKHFSIDYRLSLRDGTTRIMHAQAELIHDANGSQVILSGTVQDITERRQAEKALRERDELLQQAVRVSEIGIFDHDQRTDTIYWSPQQRIIHGWDPDEPVSLQDFLDCVHPADIESISAAVRRAHDPAGDGIWNVEHRIIRRDGSVRWLKERSQTFFEGEGNTRRPVRTVGAVLDITARKEAEEKVRQSEEFIRGILDTVDEGFIVVDRDYRILTANRAYCAQVALPVDVVIGKHCFELSHRVSRPCYEEGEECAVRQVFVTGRPHAALHKHPDPEGHTLFVETKAFPIKDASGAVTSVIETINNITERHLLEEERLKTQKLESIGVLAGGIAHDFNNLLQGIFGYMSMAKLTLDQREKSLAMLEQAEKALHQSVNLTSQLLTFSKGGKPVKNVIDLRPVIENAATFALSGSRSDFRVDIDPGLWHADADGGQVGQVIQNIVLNADQAMPRGGRVAISARNLPASETESHAGLERRDYVVIGIEDQGVGIQEAHLDKIFDPYFTTKEKGSGLGLATSYSIIRNHGGRIEVRSVVGKGSTFHIYLPATRTAAPLPAERPQPASTRKARVLVMDDELIIRKVAQELLGSLGHDVAVAENGDAAVEQYRRAIAEGRPFDVVILDLTVRGGKGGAETMRELLAIDPGVKAVVSSGYSDDQVIATFRQHGFCFFLKKPYDIQELGRVLNDVMA